MKILSIDVGIKNLAFCLLDTTTSCQIIKWDIIDLSQKEEMKCCEIEKNKICDKPAKFIKNSKCYCLKHSKKQDFQIPTSELNTSHINKQKIAKLYEIADKYKIQFVKPIKKPDLIVLINEYIYNTCFDIIGKTNASKIDLVTIGRNIQHKLDIILEEHIQTIDTVIIENQISPIANRMKTIQGMIAQYFIMRNNNISIEFVNASNKLKEYIESKSTYSDRKKLGIQKCLELINTHLEWDTFFKNHSKKDDLADSFLQGIWFINKIE